MCDPFFPSLQLRQIIFAEFEQKCQRVRARAAVRENCFPFLLQIKCCKNVENDINTRARSANRGSSIRIKLMGITRLSQRIL